MKVLPNRLKSTSDYSGAIIQVIVKSLTCSTHSFTKYQFPSLNTVDFCLIIQQIFLWK